MYSLQEKKQGGQSSPPVLCVYSVKTKTNQQKKPSAVISPINPSLWGQVVHCCLKGSEVCFAHLPPRECSI